MPWSLVALLSTAQFLANADRSMAAVVATDLRNRFALSDAQIGSLQGAPFIVGYLLALLCTSLRPFPWAPNRYMAFCVATWTLGALGFALSSGFGELLASRLVLATGQAAFLPAAVILLDGGGPENRARALSIFSASSAMGRSGGLLIGGLLLTTLTALAASLAMGSPWRWTVAALLIPNLVVVWLLLRLTPAARFPTRSNGLPGVSARLVCENRRAIGWIAAAAGVIAIVQSVGAWAPAMLHRRYGLETGVSAVVVGVLTLTAAPLGHLIAGRWIARRGRGPDVALLLGGSVILAAAAACLAAASSVFSLVLIGLGVLIATSGFGAAVALIHFQRLVDRPDQRSANTVYFFVVTLVGTAAGPYLTGLVSDRLAPDGSGLAVAIAIVTAAAALLVWTALLLTRRDDPAAGENSRTTGINL